MRHVSYDIGTKTLKAFYNEDQQPVYYIREHHSDPLKIIRDLDRKLFASDNSSLQGIVTGRYQNILSNDNRYKPVDWTIPLIRFTKQHYGDVRYVIDFGAASLSLLEIRNGQFHRFQTNSLCASGTGSFLDQQMLRMELSFSDIDSIKPTKRIPSIASRCAVFAKSDLIHRQQEGYTIEELWNGLVKGLAESCYVTLLRGTAIEGKLLLIGGLIKNSLFLHYFSGFLPGKELIIPECPEGYVAHCSFDYLKSDEFRKTSGLNKTDRSRQAYEKKLLFKSDNNNHLLANRYIDRHGNEINIDTRFEEQAIVNYTENSRTSNLTPPLIQSHGMQCYPEGEKETSASANNGRSKRTLSVYFGVDIGSTSTKGVLVDADSKQVIFNIYRKTAGNPISAYQKLLKGIDDYCKKHNLDLIVKGMGTTGSGRRIVGNFAGADLIVNEITAHLKGALRDYNPRTIFEIGGQDSKYILIADGWMKDANMNYACAAGTGSFLEEQAQVLNIGLDDFERLSCGIAAPKMNDRCTVFMEMDAQKLIVDGHSKPEVVTSLLHAVCRNYLHRVVQNRPIEEPILFLGATARNKGLVEAFQNILDKKIMTSKHSHIMGALGMTELLAESTNAEETKFKGLNLHEQSLVFREKECSKCQNRCLIIYLETEDSTVSWGHKCGKETLDSNNAGEYNELFNQDARFSETESNRHAQTAFPEPAKEENLPVSEKNIYIPKALFYYSHYPFWQVFWKELGFNLLPSFDSTREIVDLGLQYSPNEICYPMKLAMGHIIKLVKKNLFPVFVPYIIRDTPISNTTNSYFCVITQSLPAIARSILRYNNLPDDQLIDSVVDFSSPDAQNIQNLHDSLSKRFHLPKAIIARAFRIATNRYAEHQERVFLKGQTISEKLDSSKKPVLVIMGRSYNLYDESLNLSLIKDTAQYGFSLLPYDLVPAKREEVDPEFKNMFWSYGQRFISAAKKLISKPNCFPVFLTNFNCGPDSFLLSFLEEIWTDKPSLILELDEHSGNAGYLTRIEAFLDRIKDYRKEPVKKEERKPTSKNGVSKSPANPISLKERPLLFPPMHPHGTRLLSAAFRAHNYKAIPLLKEDRESFQLGKARLRGSECLPAASTLGSLLHYYQENGTVSQDNTAFFMPCASGPCRFGQYGSLQQMILKRMGYDTEVLSVNSEDNYGGASGSLRLLIAKSIVITDIIIKLGCKLRPYSDNPESLEQLLEDETRSIIEAIESQNDIPTALKSLKERLTPLNTRGKESKPLVGIVGEIYVRCSPFSNNHVIRKIEEQGAEAWVAPFMEWLHYTTWLKKKKKDSLIIKLKDLVTNSMISNIENGYYDIFGKLLEDRREPTTELMVKKAEPYISEAIRGEVILTIGRTLAFIEEGAKLIINVAPFSCMPGTIGSIILKRISQEYEVPIISLYYDGFTSFDSQLEHYLNNLHQTG